jgi:DNA mismatch repair ATPase MutL
MKTEIDLTPSPRLLQVLGDIPLHPWQCLSELIDNCLDDMSRASQVRSPTQLRVDVRVKTGSRGERILVVADNGSGMTEEGLAVALRAGATTKAR